jgi:glyoxylase I family protein
MIARLPQCSKRLAGKAGLKLGARRNLINDGATKWFTIATRHTMLNELGNKRMGATGMTDFRILGLDHVVLRIADRARALAFYVDVLGLKIEREQPRIGLIQLRAGRSLIDLVMADSPRDGVRAQHRNLDHFALEIEPFDEAALRAYLGGHGVEIGESGQRYGAGGEGPSLYIFDPDGNQVELKSALGDAG